MDNSKLGKQIYQLRKENRMTQLQLAQRMHISDKTVSKWERGLGCPDISLLTQLAELFHVDLDALLAGEWKTNEAFGGNMKKLQFYYCPTCGNLITAGAEASVTCCGKRLDPLQPQKAAPDEKLKVERVEDEYYITSGHPMERGHYITFVALLTGDSLVLRKQYPEWGLQLRIPMLAHGKLLWHCSNHGLFYQNL